MPMSNTCPVCESTTLTELLKIGNLPIHCNLLWDSQSAALSAPVGDMHLVFCEDCGHIFNQSFDPTAMAYTQAYENSLHFSPKFQTYVQSLAQDLVIRHQLYAKNIVEIGSGQGDFLKLLCSLGENTGIGFDPSYIAEDDSVDERVTFVLDFYSPKYADIPAEFICSRHVLEHIRFPTAFLKNLKTAISDRWDTTVFFEVPNVRYTLADMGIWDLIYEHTSYFSADSLSTAFQRAGFLVTRQATVYGNQFLTIEAKSARDTFDSVSDEQSLTVLTSLAMQFSDKYRQKLEYWQNTLQTFRTEGKRVVVWGGGSKGVTFLNVLRAQSDIKYVVDINPRKQGKFIAGTGQTFVPPDFLRDYQPDVVLLMNPLYTDEIKTMMVQLGVSAKILQV